MRPAHAAALVGVGLSIGIAGGVLVSSNDDAELGSRNAEARAGEQITSWEAAVVQLDRFLPGTPKNARSFATIYVMFDVGPERIERRLRLTYSGGEGRLALVTKAVGVRGVVASPRCVKARFSVPPGVLLTPLADSIVDASEPHEMQLKESVDLPPAGSCRRIPIEVDL